MAVTRSTKPKRQGARSFVLSVCALEGGGKTQFGTTAPMPISYHAVDPNTEAVLQKIYGVDDLSTVEGLMYHKLKMPAIAFSDQQDVQTEAEACWDSFIDSLRPIVREETDTRSVVLDTATEFDTLTVLAEFGNTDQITPHPRPTPTGPPT